MEYKFSEKELRNVCTALRSFELEVLYLKKMIEDLKFEILGFTKEQEEKENGTL